MLISSFQAMTLKEKGPTVEPVSNQQVAGEQP
jgi:hypothetical protein